MKREDLKLGEYYVYDTRQILIFKGINENTKCLVIEGKHFLTQNYAYSLPDIRLATPEEKHWLDECINKDTFVPREIAMASFKVQAEGFIFGKWYRANNDYTKKWDYIKVLNHIQDSYVQLKGETIDADGRYHAKSYWTSRPSIAKALELGPMSDLTEIQAFLPDGHSDKIMKTVSVSKYPSYVRCCFCDTTGHTFKKGNVYKTYPGLHIEGSVYIKRDTDGLISDYSLNGGVWKFEACEGPETQIYSPKETVKPERSQFLKDDYIVTLEDISSSLPKNHVFKQRLDADYLRVYKDTSGVNNGNTIATINKTSLWRYATTQEIMEYNIQDKPVDVTRIGMTPVLPAHNHKWVVKRTADNYVILNNWANTREDGSHGHSLSDGWMHSINYGGSGHSGDGHYYADSVKHPDHTEITTEQFKRDIMREPDNNTHIPDTFPLHWYMTVTKDNLWDAEMWRWDGNLSELKLEIGSVVGMHTRHGKCHNRNSTDNHKEFGKEISYSDFKSNVFPNAERSRLLQLKYPIGSCIVVTKPSTSYNGKLNYCYQVVNYGTSENPNLYYENNNSIPLCLVEVRKALTNEKTRYKREGKPYDVKSLENVSKYEINNGIPKYVKIVSYGHTHQDNILSTDNPPPKEFNSITWPRILIECGRLADGSFVPATREDYEAFVLDKAIKAELISMPEISKAATSFNTSIRWSATKEPDRSATKEEILAYCKLKYPKGTVVKDTYGHDCMVSEELRWEGSAFISHPGLCIVYDTASHTFAPIVKFVHGEESMFKTLPKKAKMSDVSALVNYQEPVIVNREKTKRSKLVIINK